MEQIEKTAISKYQTELNGLDAATYEKIREEGIKSYVYANYFLAADIDDLQNAFDFYQIPAKIFKQEAPKTEEIKEYFSEKLYTKIKITVNKKNIDCFVRPETSINNWIVYSYYQNKMRGLPNNLALYIAIESNDFGMHKGFLNFEDAQKYLCDNIIASMKQNKTASDAPSEAPKKEAAQRNSKRGPYKRSPKRGAQRVAALEKEIKFLQAEIEYIKLKMAKLGAQ